MKNVILLAIILLASCNNSTTEDQKDKVKLVYLTYPSGTPLIQGQIEKNNPVGIWKTYYPNGKLFTYSDYSSSVEGYLGQYREYDEHGSLIIEKRELESNNSNHYTFSNRYYKGTGILDWERITEVFIEYDEHHEIQTENEREIWFYENGKIRCEKYYEHGNLTHIKMFDTNGNVLANIETDGGEYILN